MNSERKAPPGVPRTVAEALGQIVWVLSQSVVHREMKVKDLEWSFMPPILHEQFRIFTFGPLPGLSEDAVKAMAPSGLSQKSLEQMPLGVAIWAKVSAEAEQKLERGERLKAEDWTSGDRVWLVELVSPFATPENKLLEAMLIDLAQGPFSETVFSLHKTDPKSGRRDRVNVGSHIAAGASSKVH
jgi:cytolysin-activating lysine-acyltransferase